MKIRRHVSGARRPLPCTALPAFRYCPAVCRCFSQMQSGCPCIRLPSIVAPFRSAGSGWRLVAVAFLLVCNKLFFNVCLQGLTSSLSTLLSALAYPPFRGRAESIPSLPRIEASHGCRLHRGARGRTSGDRKTCSL